MVSLLGLGGVRRGVRNTEAPLLDVERKSGAALFRKNNIGVYWVLTFPSVAETQWSVFLRPWQALGGCGHAPPGQNLLGYSWGAGQIPQGSGVVRSREFCKACLHSRSREARHWAAVSPTAGRQSRELNPKFQCWGYASSEGIQGKSANWQLFMWVRYNLLRSLFFCVFCLL